MDQQPITSPPPQPAASRRGFRLALWVIAGLAAVVIGVVSYRYIARELALRRAEMDLRDALAEVNAAELNGWQLQDLEAQREKIPEAQNGRKFVVAAAKLLPDGWKNERIFDEVHGLPPPAMLRAEHVESLRAFIAKVGPALDQARKLVDFPRGRFAAVPPSGMYFGTAYSHVRDVRDVAVLLYCDALHRCQHDDRAMAWDSAVATLHAGRSIGDEPAIQSQLSRMAAQALAVEAMERILGHGELDASALAQARELLRDEAAQNLIAHGIRGERAGQHRFYTELASGKLDLNQAARRTQANEWDTISEPTKRLIIVGSHGYSLRTMTSALACSNKPDSERYPCFMHWDALHKNRLVADEVPRLAKIFTPAIRSIAFVETKNHTLMQCAVTALAAEEFRVRDKRWPKDLDELVASRLLSKIPIDRLDGKPLGIRHAPDGLVVYSATSGVYYEGEAWDTLGSPPQPDIHGIERWRAERVEFRLWNPDRRRQPPVLPRVDDVP